MGFIGDLFSSDKGAGFQGKNADLQQAANTGQANQLYNQAQQGIGQQQNFVNALAAQNGIGNQSSVFGQQQALANQLQDQAAGGGPNPALQQLQNTTGQNVSNQAALMASQRGTGANPGMLARQAAMQGGNIQQQAAGQGALMRMQQQLAAQQALQQQQGMMGNLASQQVGQQAGALGGLNNATQSEQGNILGSIGQANQANVGMQSNINNANAEIAKQNAAGQSQMLGGLLNGAAMGFHSGGMVGHYADGGSVAATPSTPGGPSSFIGKFAKNYGSATGPTPGASMNPSFSAGQGMGQLLGKGIGAGAGAIGSLFKGAPEQTQVEGIDAFNKGGSIHNMKKGGKVPGAAKVKGDDLKNDTVPAMLSPKEIVLPRSVTTHPDAPAEAAKFVAAILAKQGMKGKK